MKAINKKQLLEALKVKQDEYSKSIDQITECSVNADNLKFGFSRAIDMVEDAIKEIEKQEIKDYNNGTLRPKVGMACNYRGYSDVEPWEVVEVNKSGKTITIRKYDTELINGDDLKFHAGGFAAHCSNQRNQKYTYTSNPKNATIQVRLSKKGFGKGRFHVTHNPYKFYDYNF